MPPIPRCLLELYAQTDDLSWSDRQWQGADTVRMTKLDLGRSDGNRQLRRCLARGATVDPHFHAGGLGMSRPLLKLRGGSDEILRDVRLLAPKPQAFVACA